MICWTYHALSSFAFCSKPVMISDKNTRQNILIIISLCSIHKGITANGEHSCYLREVLVLGQRACPWETFKICFGEVFSPPTSTFVYLPQDSCQRDM
jgi:hypothetical protein